MDCSEVHARLSDYLDEALPPEEQASVADHLAECRRCSAARDKLRGYLSAMQSLERHPAPPGFAETVIRRIHEHPNRLERLRRLLTSIPMRLPLGMAGLAAALLLVIFTYRERMIYQAVPAIPRAIEAPARGSVDGKADDGEALYHKEIRPPDPRQTDSLMMAIAPTSRIDLTLQVPSGNGEPHRERLRGPLPMPLEAPARSHPARSHRDDPKTAAPNLKASLSSNDRIREIRAEIVKIIGPLGGNLVPGPTGMEKEGAESVTVELPPARYPAFRKALERLGGVTGPVQVFPPEDGALTVTVHIESRQTP